MVSFQEARRIAQKYLNANPISVGDKVVDRCVILDEKSRDLGCAWMFEYQSEEYLKTGDVLHKLLSGGPLVVSKRDGELRRVQSPESLRKALAEWGPS